MWQVEKTTLLITFQSFQNNAAVPQVRKLDKFEAIWFAKSFWFLAVPAALDSLQLYFSPKILRNALRSTPPWGICRRKDNWWKKEKNLSETHWLSKRWTWAVTNRCRKLWMKCWTQKGELMYYVSTGGPVIRFYVFFLIIINHFFYNTTFSRKLDIKFKLRFP